jgi:RNA 3'-terminal phosphate cyclase (ATP)
MNVRGTIHVSHRGHYPKGRGTVRLTTTPTSDLKSIIGRDSGGVRGITGVSHSVKLPVSVAERQASAASRVIEEKGFPRPKIEIDASENGSHMGPGSGIVLCATRSNEALLGADSLGERGRPAEVVGEDAARRLLEEIGSGAFLDRHMGDIIVPYVALAEGVSDLSLSQVTLHTLTNVKVVEQIAGVQFDPIAEVEMPGRLRVRGLGLRREEVSVSPKE